MTRRIRRSLAAGLAAVSILAAGCESSSERGVNADDLPAITQKSALAPRAFTAEIELAGRVLGVDGVIEDDYRYQATVTLDGSPLYEEVVVDDRRYVRVIDASGLVPPALAAELPQIHESWPLILAGAWVVDPVGAPREFTSGRKPIDAPLSPDTVLSRVRYLDDAGELIDLGYSKYDRDSIQYSRRNDKFPRHEEDGARFDHVPPGYDPNRVYATLESVLPSFEFVSVWATEDMVTRIERLAELPDPADTDYRELYEQLDRAGSRRLLALIELGAEGRHLAETYTMRPLEPSGRVVEPEGATPVSLGPPLTALAARLAGVIRPTPLYGRID